MSGHRVFLETLLSWDSTPSDNHPFIGSADWSVHVRNAGLFLQDPPIFVEGPVFYVADLMCRAFVVL